MPDLPKEAVETCPCAVSYPESPGCDDCRGTGYEEALRDAPIQRPGKVYVEHDNDARTGEWMDSEQVNAMVRKLNAPAIRKQRDEELRERLVKDPSIEAIALAEPRLRILDTINAVLDSIVAEG